MGEHEFRHLPSPEQVAAGRKDRDVTIDISGPAGRKLFQLSATYNTAFQIHYEIEDRLLPPLESMLARYPKAKVIWCHLAMIRHPDRAKKYGPAYVTSLIERFPGLHFDLAVPAANHVYKPTGAHDSTLYARNGALKPEWRAVIERHPQRFLAASDYRPPIEQKYGGQYRAPAQDPEPIVPGGAPAGRLRQCLAAYHRNALGRIAADGVHARKAPFYRCFDGAGRRPRPRTTVMAG